MAAKAWLDVFMDVTCPYCRKGYGWLRELIGGYPNVEVSFRPVEAHPRDEEPGHRPYADLTVMGAFYVKDNGGDEWAYYDDVYNAYFHEGKDVEKPETIEACAAIAMEKESALGAGGKAAAARGFCDAARTPEYLRKLKDANAHAYDGNGVWAVPTFVCGKERLDAVEGVGVTKEEIRQLLERISPK